MAMERWRPVRGLIPWQPFSELEELGRRFEDIFGRPILPMWRRFPLEERGWVPSIDVFEKEDKYIVKAELPGMDERDIDISVAGDTLRIKGERQSESEVKEEDYHCCERSYETHTLLSRDRLFPLGSSGYRLRRQPTKSCFSQHQQIFC